LTIYTHEEEGSGTSPASNVGVIAMAAEIAVDPQGAIWLAAGPEGIIRLETD